jgi:hypothetical protein
MNFLKFVDGDGKSVKASIHGSIGGAGEGEWVGA